MNRPVINLKTSEIDWFLESLALGGLLALLVVVAAYYSQLPDQIPSHFGLTGIPDDYSSKKMLWLLVAITVSLYGLLTHVAIKIPPHRFNYPVKVTEKNAACQYRYAIRLVRGLKAIIVNFFSFVATGTIWIALGRLQAIGLWPISVFLFLIVAAIGTYLFVATTRQ